MLLTNNLISHLDDLFGNDDKKQIDTLDLSSEDEKVEGILHRAKFSMTGGKPYLDWLCLRIGGDYIHLFRYLNDKESPYHILAFVDSVRFFGMVGDQDQLLPVSLVRQLEITLEIERMVETGFAWYAHTETATKQELLLLNKALDL